MTTLTLCLPFSLKASNDCITLQRQLTRLSLYLNDRPLLPEEAEAVCQDQDLKKSLNAFLPIWRTSENYGESWVRFLIDSLRSNGQRAVLNDAAQEIVDLDHPVRLMRHIIKNRLPYAQILKADYCIDKIGTRKNPCDSKAPYVAGIITSRGFLSQNSSLFNLHRSVALLDTFLCRRFPLEPTVHPRVPKEQLITLFAQEKAEEGGPTFGNGNGCNSCHSQFAGFAQIFNLFNREGIWSENHGGTQSPEHGLGIANNLSYVSHFVNPEQAKSQSTVILGRKAASIPEAMGIITDHPLFAQCAVEKLLKGLFGPEEALGLIPSVAEQFGKAHTPSQFSYDDLVQFVFNHQKVIVKMEAGKP